LILFSIGCWMLAGCGSAPPGKGVSLDYKVLRFDVPNDEMWVEVSIANHSGQDLIGGQWELHWNQISGGIDPKSLPEGLRFEWVNGNSYFIMHFEEPWTLKRGDSCRFIARHEGIMRRLAVGPVGFFGVMRGQPFEVSGSVQWKGAEGLENLNLPSPEEQYRQLEALSTHPPDSLHWVVPTATHASRVKGFRPASEVGGLFLAAELDSLRADLFPLVTQIFPRVRWSNSENDAPFLIHYNSTLPDEAYNLIITPNHVQMEVASFSGAVYALQTLRQIDWVSKLESTGWPLIEIKDAPRFKYRGFLLDLARNYHGLKKIKQIIDVMSLFKLNHLELKLTDDEGWRLEIPGLPELTEVGSRRGYTATETDRLIPMYGSGAEGSLTGNGFLRREDFIELLQYARNRNITIIPQISFPTHARAAVVSMEARRQRYQSVGNTRKAEEYALSDPQDQSTYRSAQLYNDNIINICRESSFTFFEHIVSEVAHMYNDAGLELKQMSIGADELPRGAWEGSPLCSQRLANEPQMKDLSDIYIAAIGRLKDILGRRGVMLSGWEDFLLEPDPENPASTRIQSEHYNHEVIPYVWNCAWNGGREDMVYRFANRGFNTVMCNSSAFYFDMVDDAGMENHGLNWSGYVDGFDTWAIDPEDIFANHYLNQKHGLTLEYIASKERLNPLYLSRLLGIQSQLFTETSRGERILVQQLMPNMIYFAERAWAPRPLWVNDSPNEQKQSQFDAWNTLVHTVGLRTLPLLHEVFGGQIEPNLGMPGAVIMNDTLFARSSMPGMKLRYTLDGSQPNEGSSEFTQPVSMGEHRFARLRMFDASGRGGPIVQVDR